jgi:hypothetical protein
LLALLCREWEELVAFEKLSTFFGDGAPVPDISFGTTKLSLISFSFLIYGV